MKAATNRQKLVLAFIRESQLRDGMPPTLREIAAAMGFASTNAVSDHLRLLERKGLVKHRANKSRGWTVIQEVA